MQWKMGTALWVVLEDLLPLISMPSKPEPQRRPKLLAQRRILGLGGTHRLKQLALRSHGHALPYNALQSAISCFEQRDLGSASCLTSATI